MGSRFVVPTATRCRRHARRRDERPNMPRTSAARSSRDSPLDRAGHETGPLRTRDGTRRCVRPRGPARCCVGEQEIGSARRAASRLAAGETYRLRETARTAELSRAGAAPGGDEVPTRSVG